MFINLIFTVSNPRFANARLGRTAPCVALMALAGSTVACELPPWNAKSANQYVSLQPSGSPPVLSGYQFDLGKTVTAEACAEPNTRYEVALAGVSGTPSLGELAAAREALTKLGDADMLLVIHSTGFVSNEKNCGAITGRGIKLRTVDLPLDGKQTTATKSEPVPTNGTQPTKGSENL